MIVAIDGPAGSGKSTIASALAKRFGFEKLDTGAMYRAVAFTAQDRGIDLDDEEAVTALASTVTIRFAPGEGMSRITVDDHDVSREIRTPAVDATVSKVAAYAGVRKAMLEPQRAAAQEHDIVAEGRDIGTVVFPKADVKVFLTADPRERARRRVLQRHAGEAIDAHSLEREVDETLAALERRDAADSGRAVAPLIEAEDAVEIDSTAYSIDEVCDRIAELIEERR